MIGAGAAVGPDRDPAVTSRLLADLARLILVAALVMALSLIAWGLVPMLWGWQSYVVVSGSMGPLVRAGDVVVASGYDHRAELEPGTVVVIDPAPIDPARIDPAQGARSDDGPVTHRVVERLPSGRYRTRGDANQGADSRLVGPEEIRARARLVVPVIGQPKLMIDRHPLPVAVLLLLILVGAAALYRNRTNDRSGRPDGRLLSVLVVTVLCLVTSRPPTQAGFTARTTTPAAGFSSGDQFYYRRMVASAPVSYWRLGDTSTTVGADVTGLAPLTLSGTRTRSRSGALKADTDTATQFVNTATAPGIGSATTSSPAPAALAISGALTVAAWVKVTATQPAGARVVIKWNGTRLNYLLAWSSAPSTSMRFLVDDAGGTRYQIASAYPYDSGWHFIVGVFDGAAIRLYLDGSQPVAAVPVTGPLFTAVANPVTLSAPTSNGMTGDLDEVAIWSRALTATEISALYTVATT